MATVANDAQKAGIRKTVAVLAVFAVAVFARYLEIGAGMLGTGTSMVVGGALLIGLGVGLERARRSIVARMHSGEVAR